MLAELQIRDYALIEDLAVGFGPGLNVLTGETGTGKSIILGALSLVLGERPDAAVIRTGADRATVEARFEDAQSAEPECGQLGIECTDGVLVLRRRTDRTGRNAAYANDSGITVRGLRRIGDRLIDLHGQHQHQLLLNAETHREILDAYAGLTAGCCQFTDRFRDLADKRTELTGRKQELKARVERRELTEYQFRELNDADVQPDETGSLNKERELLESAERRYALARELEQLLSEQEGSVAELLALASRKLEELGRTDESLVPKRRALADAEAATDDLWRELVRYRENIQVSPDRLEAINARLFLIEKLQSKYRLRADELPELTARLKQELDSIGLDDSRCRDLKEIIKREQTQLLRQAESLSDKRRKAKARIEKAIRTEFAALGLDKARLIADITRPEKPGPDSLSPTGIDTIQFLFTANPGEEARPLCKVASGGELSRIMLGLKNVLAKVDPVGTMVFDEIDVGIGGRVAEAVGNRLARLGRNRQVICITHLPQIAKYADRHFLVTKSTRKGRTTTAIRRLDREDRTKELARMVAGADITGTSLAHAREMLSKVKRG